MSDEEVSSSEISEGCLAIKELIELIEENNTIIYEVEAENHMLSRYIKKFDVPSDSSEIITSKGLVNRSESLKNRGRVRDSVPERVLALSDEQKCLIAQVEIEDYKQDLINLKNVSEKIIENYNAIMEEAELKSIDLKKFSYDFERDVVKKSFNPRLNAIVSEKFIRFLEEYLRTRDTLMDKLRLKISSLNPQKKKLRSQLQQKEEIGEVLREVDFKQLKIENAQYLMAIDEKNEELLKLKLSAGKILQVLNSFKKRLNALLQESRKLNSELKQREGLIERTRSEEITTEAEKRTLEITAKSIQEQISKYKVPAVMDFIETVKYLNILKRKEKTHMRKVEIAKITLNLHRRLWRQVTQGY